MKTKKIFAFILIAMTVFVSCSQEENAPYYDDGTGIKVEVTDEFAAAATRAAYDGFPATTFEEGDQIGIYAVNTSNSTVSSNVCFTKQSDGKWTPSSTVIYNPDYKYYAYFPYKSGAPSFVPSGSGADGKFANFLNSNTFWVANQSTKANFTTSNLMWAEGTITGTRTVKFSMIHKRGLAIISSAVNQWYYTDDAGTKHNLTPVFSGNVPYVDANDDTETRYFLLKPNTTTSVAGLSLNVGAGKYMRSEGIELTGTPSYSYKVYHYGSTSQFSSSKPSWLTITPNVVDGEPTEFAITTTNSTSTSVVKGSGMFRTVSGDASLKAASPVSNIDLSLVNNDGTTRASRTTANCYLVHAAGTYKLPLVYGNAIKNGVTNEAAYYTTQTTNTLQRLVNHSNTGITDPWIKTVVGSSPDGAELVWEDVQGMISSVNIDGDYLTFTVDEEKIAEGNAVIAAKIGSTIVWSWHIWVTAQTLSTLTAIATGSHNYQVAPVNVGQIEGTIVSGATIYAADYCTVTCTNNGISMELTVTAKDFTSGGTTYYNPSPYYQWGRKDPERSCIGAYNAAGTYVQNPTVVTGANSIGTTIQNPDKHYYNSSNYGPYDEAKYNYWDINQTSTGNITTKTTKTVYDPCPPDFCIPTGNLYYYIGNTGSSSSTYGVWQSTPPGRTWVYNSPNLFFPASGYRYLSNGSLYDVGNFGCYWTATPYSTYFGRYLNFYSSNSSWNNYNRAYGFPVRAVAEE